MIGKTISHFKILEKIGAGGMGEVYLAEDTALDRKVALKFLPPHYSSDSELIARFKREAKAAASLNHPNIITVHEVGEHEGQTFIAMEYVEGKSLRALIEEGELPLARVLDIGSQICEGLAKAHQADIVHRDIKPENIMIDEDGRVRILDFGLAKLRNVSKLTQTATTLGTLNYMSPEQLQGMEVDQRTDIWSVGVVLYEMITRKLPFQGEYEATFIYSVLHEEPQPMSEVDHQAPEQLERIVSKAISKNPEERFQNTTELLGDLRLLTEGWAKTRTKTVFSAWQRPKRHSKYLTFSAISLTLFLIVLAGYWFFNRDVASQQRITIAVVDFVNETGEPELNGLSGMLITALEQSRRLSVLTRSRMFDILKQLDKADVSQIDEVLGKAICQKANVRTMAIASIKKFGRVYTIDLKLLDTDLNEYLLTVGEKGEGKESIPDLIDSIAEKTRKGLKEAEAEIRSTTQKVAAITTPNLEAYQHFFKGEELVNKLRYREAKDEFRQAIALDSTFGLAYLALAYATDWDNGDEEIVSEYVQKAVRFVDRIPEKERYLVRTYAAVLKDGWEAGLNILKQMEKLYPEDKEMTFQIGVQYYFGDDNQRALQYFEKVLDMDPEHERALNLMTLAFLDIGNLDDAFEAAKKHEKVSSKNAQSNLVLIYYYFGDYLKAEECANQLLEFDSRILDVQPWPATTAMKNILSMSERFEDMFLIAKRLASRGTSYSPLAWASASSGRFEEGLHELYLLSNQTPKEYAAITQLGP